MYDYQFDIRIKVLIELLDVMSTTPWFTVLICNEDVLPLNLINIKPYQVSKSSTESAQLLKYVGVLSSYFIEICDQLHTYHI